MYYPMREQKILALVCHLGIEYREKQREDTEVLPSYFRKRKWQIEEPAIRCKRNSTYGWKFLLTPNTSGGCLSFTPKRLALRIDIAVVFLVLIEAEF